MYIFAPRPQLLPALLLPLYLCPPSLRRRAPPATLLPPLGRPPFAHGRAGGGPT